MAIKATVHGAAKKEAVKEVSLRLVENELGVDLVAVDNKGEVIKNGCVLRILNSGMLVRVPALSKDLGMQLNEKGQILMKKTI